MTWARMRTILGRTAPSLSLVLLWAMSGCQWPAPAQPPVAQAPPQTPAPATQTVDAQPANPTPADNASPTTDLAASPQAKALEQRVQDFVNHFPDSDLARKVAGSPVQSDLAAARPPGTANDRRAAEAPGKIVRSPAAAMTANAATAQQASGLPQPVQPPGPTPLSSPNTIQRNGAALTDGPLPPTAGESPAIRANSPLSSDRPVRAASFAGADAAPAVPKVEAIEITPVPAPAPSEPTPPKAEPNRAATAAPPPKVRDIDATIAELQKSVAERPNDLAALFRLRMLYLADGLDDRATAPVVGLDPETGELFADLTRTLVAVRDAARDPLNRSTPALDQTRQLAQKLRRQAPVTIDKIALVSRVNSYGDYEEISPAEFPAGQGTRLILYAEVSNFRSEKGEGDRYRTLLGETVEVFDARGQSVFKQVHDKIPDTCRRVRNDFFLALELALPETLAPGTYTIKATVEDKLSATADQGQIAFTIAAPKQQ
jgi:hypothetical protein